MDALARSRELILWTLGGLGLLVLGVCAIAWVSWAMGVSARRRAGESGEVALPSGLFPATLLGFGLALVCGLLLAA